MASCSPSALVVDVQPSGTILFGQSVDAETFQLQGELGQATVGQDLAYRARLSRAPFGEVAITIVLDDRVVEDGIADGRYDADHDLQAGTIPGSALSREGQLVVRVTDPGDTTLALGTIGVVDAAQPSM